MPDVDADSSGRWVPERYIEIPEAKSPSGDTLLDWIGQEIEQRKAKD